VRHPNRPLSQSARPIDFIGKSEATSLCRCLRDVADVAVDRSEERDGRSLVVVMLFAHLGEYMCLHCNVTIV
jgi:hypothetical protein